MLGRSQCAAALSGRIEVDEGVIEHDSKLLLGRGTTAVSTKEGCVSIVSLKEPNRVIVSVAVLYSKVQS